MGTKIGGCLGVLASVATILGLLLVLGVIHNPFASRFGTGYYKFYNSYSGLVLEVNGSNPLHNSNGGRVDQWGNQIAPNEDWTIVDVGGNYYQIISRSSGLLLEVKGNSSGDTVDQWAAQGTPNQEWGIVDVGGNNYQIINHSSQLVLEVKDKSYAGTVDQWAAQGTPNQEWTLMSETS